MNKYLMPIVVVIAASVAADAALARGGGGGSNFMNSPSYQRRLQESRGFVTNYSNGYPERSALYHRRHRGNLR